MQTENHVPANPAIPLVVLGIPFHDVTFTEAVDWAMARIAEGQPGSIATANLDFVMQARRDPELQRILLEADLVVADGFPLIWASRLFGSPLRERVTGSDLTPLLAEACRDRGYRVFALGAGPGVAEQAMAELCRRSPGLRIAGCSSPPKADILEMDHQLLLTRLAETRPELLLVAFGAPKQEKWINMHLRRWRVPLAIGIGGTLDFLAGVQTRAPRLVQRFALEWFWRMLSDPRRLIGRYAANLLFLAGEMLQLAWLTRPGRRVAPPWPAPVVAPGLAAIRPFHPLAERRAAEAFLAATLPHCRSRSLVLTLTGIHRLSSLELGTMVTLGKACRSRGLRLFLWGLSPRLRQFLAAYRLGTYISLVDGQEELTQALAGLADDRREGRVAITADGVGEAHLPLELTAANLDPFRARLAEIWPEKEAPSRISALRLDARQLEFLDSAALGFLLGLKKRCDRQQLPLQLVGLHGAAQRAVRLARVEQLFQG
jgi:N-acetylglucosaminyldiphosphoundecaprenol N-acetyl-beta-D-mannosaminyltransferase